MIHGGSPGGEMICCPGAAFGIAIDVPMGKLFLALKEKYGIFAVRGPRGVPYSLSAALNK